MDEIVTKLEILGIKIKNEKGEFKDFSSIMSEMKVKWNDLDDKSQMELAEMVAGEKGKISFISFMES